jgi:hypothetical protein
MWCPHAADQKTIPARCITPLRSSPNGMKTGLPGTPSTSRHTRLDASKTRLASPRGSGRARARPSHSIDPRERRPSFAGGRTGLRRLRCARHRARRRLGRPREAEPHGNARRRALRPEMQRPGAASAPPGTAQTAWTRLAAEPDVETLRPDSTVLKNVQYDINHSKYKCQQNRIDTNYCQKCFHNSGSTVVAIPTRIMQASSASSSALVQMHFFGAFFGRIPTVSSGPPARHGSLRLNLSVSPRARGSRQQS